MGDIYKYKQLFWTVGNSFFHKLYILGQRIRLEKVLLVGSKDFTLIGRPFLPRDQISVEATVVEKTLTHKKVNHWRNINHRQRKTQCKLYLLKKTILASGMITLTCQIIVQKILLFFGKKTPTQPY